MQRAVNALKLSILFAFTFGAVFFIWQQTAPYSAIAIFSTEDAVLHEGARYLRSFSFDYLIVPFVFCLNGFFFGCGRTAFAAANSIFSAFAVRIPLAFILCTFIPSATLFHLGIAPPCASIVTSLCALSYLVYLSKKNILVSQTNS